MDLQLTGKHILITGGSRGIGLACARLFLQEGARVSITSRTQAHLDKACGDLARHGDVACFAAELADPAAAASMIDQAIAKAGPIDVLVNFVR